MKSCEKATILDYVLKLAQCLLRKYLKLFKIRDSLVKDRRMTLISCSQIFSCTRLDDYTAYTIV